MAPTTQSASQLAIAHAAAKSDLEAVEPALTGPLRLKNLLARLPKLSMNCTPPQQNFHPFKRLPREIRFKIWGLAANVPREIKLETWVCQFPDVEFRVMLEPPARLEFVPAILHVNGEARREGLKYYTLMYEQLFAASVGHQTSHHTLTNDETVMAYLLLCLRTVTRGIYVNFAADIFVYDFRSHFYCYQCSAIWNTATVNQTLMFNFEFINQIQRLHVEGIKMKYLVPSMKELARRIPRFTGKSLREIVIKVFDRGVMKKADLWEAYKRFCFPNPDYLAYHLWSKGRYELWFGKKLVDMMRVDFYVDGGRGWEFVRSLEQKEIVGDKEESGEAEV